MGVKSPRSPKSPQLLNQCSDLDALQDLESPKELKCSLKAPFLSLGRGGAVKIFSQTMIQ